MKRKMIFNGVNLDDTIPGFRTLSVSGRQFNGIDIESTENPADGSTFVSNRIPKRELTVSFMLKPTEASMREAQDELLSYLNFSEPKKLIFTDESDIYFNALYSGHKVSEEHDKVRSGTITFLCLDPFKHATEEKTVTATSVDGILTAEVVNGGNVAVPIRYDITMNSDNGYIGIVGANGAMQYGFIDEADGEEYKESERLANLSDLISAADDHSQSAQHPIANYGTEGKLKTTTAWISGQTFLCLDESSIGTSKNWNGGMKTFILPADSEGETGATNFCSYFHVFIGAPKNGQTGQMTLSFLTADDVPICGVNWYKSDKTGNTGNYEIWAYDANATASSTRNQNVKILKNFSYTCSANQGENPWYWDWGHCDIKKEGSKIRFYYYGKYYTYDLPDVESMACAKVQLAIYDAKGQTGSKALPRFGMNVFRFDKTNVSKWQDVPNRYAEGDEVVISGEEGKIYVNGMPKMGDEVTGTEYFKAEPGENTIEIYNSDWAEDMTVKATIREAWL